MTTRLRVRYFGRAEAVTVGTLVTGQEGGFLFQYESDFPDLGLELAPLTLPIRNRLLLPGTTADAGFERLHSLFADSLPDGWGRRLMDRAFASRGVAGRDITPLLRLAFIGHRGMGALGYEPELNPEELAAQPLDLAQMAAEVDHVVAGSPHDVLDQLVRTGGSPGGARPKVLVGVNANGSHLVSGDSHLPPGYTHWLIKFPPGETDREEGLVEAAYADMARAAGVDMPPTQLFAAGSRHCFGVKRFDRSATVPGGRLHVQTLSALLNVGIGRADFRYEHLVQVASQLVGDQRDHVEIVRRMVFNVLAHNRDDHAKNHAFMMSADGVWRLAPAYDVLFALGPSGEHQMTIDGEGRAPTRAHLQAVARLAQVSKAEFEEIMGQVRSALADWPRFAQHYGVSQRRQHLIQQELANIDRHAIAGPHGTPVRKRRR